MKYLLVILVMLVSCTIQSQDISNQIDQYASSYEETGDFSGCISLTKNDTTIYENCFGKANASFDIKNTPVTKFKIGSVSKQFTAAAILILEQEQLLQISDTLSQFFPDNSMAAKVTIEQLLTHTSGVPDIYSIPGFNQLSCQKKTIADLSNMLFEADLDFKPGSRYQYSNGGYALLAYLIEQVSGTTYEDFLKERIFKPLKMNDTGHNSVNEIIPALAVGYDPLGYDQLKIADFLDPELLKGSGSLFSTTRDLQTWIRSIKNKSLLSKESYDKFLNDYGNNYGLGISVYTSFDQAVFGHDGRVNGFIADYLHYRESDLSIIILGNVQTGVADFFRRDIAAILFNKDYKSRAKTVAAADQATIEKEKILGTYSFGPNFKVYLELIEGTIQARANEGGYSELVLLEDGRFFSRTLYSYIGFKEDEKGTVTTMVWTNNDGNSFEGIKE